MEAATLQGRDWLTGKPIEVRFDQGILGVDRLPTEPAATSLPYVAPGFIDLQVNGFSGADYNSATTSHSDIAVSLQAQFATGVTRLFPTVITGGYEEMCGALQNLARARAKLPDGAAMEGFHVEGPYISPEDGPRGAHPQARVRPPDWDEFLHMQEAAGGHIRLLTLSPEWPEAPAFIERAAARGVVVSIGHTKATAEQIQAAVSAGATMSTHLGNGAHSVLPRHPNYIWEQLAEDRLTASFIADGIHLSDSFLRVALRAKTLERSVLVTDAVMPAGCKPGLYQLGEVHVELHPDQRVTLVGQARLAGSSLHMHKAIQYMQANQGLTLCEAITMATRKPAEICKIVSRQHGLAVGDRADLVLFQLDEQTRSLHITATYLSGRRVYEAA